MASANDALGAAARALARWAREARVAWPEFARAMMRADVRAEWERHAADARARAPGLALTGRDLLAGLAIALYGVCEALGDGDDAAAREAARDVEGAARAWADAPEAAERLAAYAAALARWKAADRDVTLRRLAQMYWEYELAYRLEADGLSEAARAHYATLRDARQAELRATMNGIDGGAFFRGFLPIAVSEDVAAAVYATLERAFWARLREDLAADPPSYASLLPVLEELRAGVCELMPRAWAARSAWFSDLFDGAFLAARVAAGGLARNFWASRCAAAMEALADLDSAEKESEHRAWWAPRREALADAAGALEVLRYVLMRVTALLEMKRAVRQG